METPFDRVTALAAALFDAPISTISTTVDGQNAFQATRGMSLSGAPCEQCLSQHAMVLGPNGVLVIEDTLADERTRCNPFVAAEPHVRFYAGAVITTADGRCLGTICVLDTVAHLDSSKDALDALRMLARLAADIFDQMDLTRAQNERLSMLNLAEQMSGVGYWRYELEPHRITWSDAVYHIHGVTRETFDPSAGGVLATYHPEDQPIFREFLDRAIRTGEGYEFKLRLHRPNGEERVATSKAETERDENGRVVALFGVFQDVTETERAVDQIQRSEARYRLLAEHSSDIITMTRVDGIFTYVSPIIETALGYRPDELVGRPYTDFVHPEDLPAMRAAFIDYVNAGPGAPSPRVVWRTFKKNGELVWFEGHPKLTWDAKGRPLEIQDLLRDVTENKRLEAELLEARDNAEAGARAKSEFLANMSHELRTPLTSVIGFAGLLRASDNLPEIERGHADRIQTASDALLSVINDILDYSKLEAEAVEMEPRAFDPRALTDGAVAIIESQCRSKGLTLDVEIDPALPSALTGDEGRLRQVMLNFMSNAVKFTPHGGIELTVGGRRAANGHWALRISVTDTGIGMSADQLATMFVRFTQADASTTRIYGGTGLGLAISRRLVELMGGTVGVDSCPGKGSTFWLEVTLPETDLVADSAPDETAMPEGNYFILVADDAAANRELIVAILGGLGLRVDAVRDGAEAVQAASTGQYDLVLMDVQMPVMDGLAATRAIRAMDGPVAGLPILALSANVQREQIDRCLAAGMDGHLGKPIQIPELAEALSRHLKPAATNHQAA